MLSTSFVRYRPLNGRHRSECFKAFLDDLDFDFIKAESLIGIKLHWGRWAIKPFFHPNMPEMIVER
jgi:hypothetical protein